MADNKEAHVIKEKKVESRIDRFSKWVPTLMLVLAIITAAYTAYYMDEQVDEMKKATMLEWRPYLHLDYTTVNFAFAYNMINDTSNTPIYRQFKTIDVTSDVFRGVEKITIHHANTRQYRNSGKTPLRLTKQRNKCITQEVWDNHYNKSLRKLVQDINNGLGYDSLQTDVPIFPDSIKTFDENKTGIVDLEKKFVYEKEWSIVLYPYTYVEYEDFFGNKFNAISMHYVKIDFFVKDNYLFNSDPEVGVEQYRWDVLID